MGVRAPTPRPSLLAGRLGQMMVDAPRHAGTPLARERLFGWHAALFPTGRSGMHRTSVGAWRTRESGPLQVVSGPIGRERLYFEAPAAERLDGEMTAFLEWFERPSSLDPVLKAGVAHFWFVTVHPFEDGNGRIARAIADMALERSEGLRDRFYSMSAQIERERDAYYLQLELCQRGALDITAWLDWFLGCLGRAIDGTDEALAAVLGKAVLWQHVNRHPVEEYQRRVINRLLDGFAGFLTTSKYAAIAKCSTATALRDIGELVSRGILVRNPGGGRSTSYRLATAAELAAEPPPS